MRSRSSQDRAGQRCVFEFLEGLGREMSAEPGRLKTGFVTERISETLSRCWATRANTEVRRK